MKIIMFASGEIAIPTLGALVKTADDMLLVTVPDKRKGRHLRVVSSLVKTTAQSLKIRVLQPVRLSDTRFIAELSQFKPDYFVVFSYGKRIPQALLKIPSKMPLNIHASLLPKYRGAAPIAWAIIRGEAETGITIIHMNEKIDEGDIVISHPIGIDYNDTALSLEEKLAQLAPQVMGEVLRLISDSKVTFRPQDSNQATFAPKLRKTEGKINWGLPAEQIRNFVRGCNPWPGAFTTWQGEVVKIWDIDLSQIQPQTFSPGEITQISRKGISVRVGDGVVLITELQLESGKRLSAWQFAQGHPLSIGQKLA